MRSTNGRGAGRASGRRGADCARPLAALRSLDRSGHVIYVGSFSKVLFPSLRLGYLVIPPGLREDYVNAKWQDDFGSPAIEQAAMAGFIGDGGFERHLRRTARALEERRSALLAALHRELGDELDIADSQAGMHLVAWLRRFSPGGVDALIASAAAISPVAANSASRISGSQ